MALTVESSNYIITSTKVTSNTVTAPTGITVGDLLVMILQLGQSGTIPSAPTGWTLIQSSVHDRARGVVFYKLADSTDAAAASFSISWTGSTGSALAVLRISGHDSTNPLDTSATNGDNQNHSSWSAASVTTSTDNDLVIQVSFGGWENATYTGEPSGWTLLINSADNNSLGSDGVTLGVAYKTQASAGAVTMGTWTPGFAIFYGTVTAAFQPSTPGVAFVTQATVLALGSETSEARVKQAAVLALGRKPGHRIMVPIQ